MNTHNHWYAYLNPFLRTTPLLCAVLFVPGPPMSTRVCALRIDLPLEFSLLYLPLLMKLAVSQASSNTICVQSRKSCLIYGSITEWELERSELHLHRSCSYWWYLPMAIFQALLCSLGPCPVEVEASYFQPLWGLIQRQREPFGWVAWFLISVRKRVFWFGSLVFMADFTRIL